MFAGNSGALESGGAERGVFGNVYILYVFSTIIKIMKKTII